MPIILNIDCSQETASICLAKDEKSLGLLLNDNQSDHASWIHIAIEQLMAAAGISLQQLEAVAVTIGPGSYTGLRVGLATAKGLCYALRKPLITIPTLKMMAYAARNTNAELICPMIDARRMEVYAAIYDKKMTEIVPAEALTIEPTTYHQYITAHPICFLGSGSKKLQSVLTTANATFEEISFNAIDLIALSLGDYQLQAFASLAYTEPLYIKDFYTAGRRK
jgi:tRNA threonylcarbamoyladenosine biosynthesis protein TsaB